MIINFYFTFYSRILAPDYFNAIDCWWEETKREEKGMMSKVKAPKKVP